ncbi:hypothetical protein [Methanococcoides alaskense]|uniref:Uncharacterized protein n=2 Tax=Methanococcoides alaskense TaxID=325778 RepID=A0AA90ZDH9_9EURY|nr:hypothetical protein [Methanococcoides alaskense]MDR6223523.1 hypothetical protein [Methanococcoides alaskense]
MTSTASAATTIDLQDPEGKYTFKITFQNGEKIEYDPGYYVEGRGGYVNISFEDSWDHQNTVDVKIEVEGADIKEWELLKKGFPIKRSYETTDEFALPFSSGCTQLKYCGSFYTVHVTSKGSKGSANLPFILVATADETDDFFITPTYQEIEYGKTIDFTLKNERNGIYSEIDHNEVKWIVGQSKSLSEYRDNVIIGTIDKSGVFTSQEIGTCTVFARMDGKIVDQAEVVVTCPSDKKADLQEVIRLYQLRIPEGPYHRDLKAGDVWPPFSSMNPGYATNLYSIANDKYGEFTCGGYQHQVLVFLSKIQSTPGECHLLDGYDFGPIEGSYSAHHAVVVYPKGTDWKRTGMVFDPWYHQKPEAMTISVWEDVFSPIAGDTSPGYRNEFNSTKDPNDYQYAAWTVAGDLVSESVELIGDAGALVGFGQCPVNILITDSNGRQLGAVDDSNMVFDIPDAFITKMADGEGGYSWYFILQNTDEYDVDITGFDDGNFEFFVMNTNTGQLQDYGEQVIRDGETAEVELDPQDSATPMRMPDGSEVIPTVEELVIPEISGSTMTLEDIELPGFDILLSIFAVFLVMLFRRR